MNFIQEIMNGKRKINPSITRAISTMIVMGACVMFYVCMLYVFGIDII